MFSLIFSGVLYAQNPDQVFDGANQRYQQGRFSEARDSYELLLNNGYESGPLYYNLGNAYYKLGNIAHGILHYERGLRLTPNDEDLKHNLQLANLMTVDKIEAAPRLFVWDYWDGVKGMFSASEILWVTYAAFVLVFVSLSVLVPFRSYTARRLALFSTLATSFIFLLVAVVCVNRIMDLSRTDYAIVTAEIIAIKNSPDPKSTDAFVLHGGVKVQITDRVSNWAKIRLVDGKIGWMEESAAEVI